MDRASHVHISRKAVRTSRHGGRYAALPERHGGVTETIRMSRTPSQGANTVIDDGILSADRSHDDACGHWPELCQTSTRGASRRLPETEELEHEPVRFCGNIEHLVRRTIAGSIRPDAGHWEHKFRGGVVPIGGCVCKHDFDEQLQPDHAILQPRVFRIHLNRGQRQRQVIGTGHDADSDAVRRQQGR